MLMRTMAQRFRHICIGLAAAAAASAEPELGDQGYRVDFRAAFQAGSGSARARIVLLQQASLVRELDFRMPAPQYGDVSADGELFSQDDRWIWRPPAAGGMLNYTVRVASTRGGQPDARMTDRWVIMRLEDLFPAARARALKTARGSGTLQLSGPAKWSFETAYGNVTAAAKALDVDRIYPQPKGWMIGGTLGVRRQQIAERRVAVAAPTDSGLRRMDMLTFLHWTLPAVTAVLPEFPERLLIVGAPDPMWRGALSAPGSLYFHADRPLVSENGTSTLVHELIHVGGVHSAAPGADWIVEGLAEYYALEILVRTEGMASARRQRVLRDLRGWVERAKGTLADPSKGADTARAALLFAALDEELQAGGASLDEVTQRLASTSFSTAALLAAAREVLGRDSRVLARELPRSR